MEFTSVCDKNILDIIKKVVANYYNIPIKYLSTDFKKNNNKKKVRDAMKIAIYLSCELTSIELTIIANSFEIYDNERFSAKAFICHISHDFAEYFSRHKNLEIEVKKLKSLCEKKINDEIKKIIKGVDIVDVIRNYIPLEKRGKNYFGICPFHEDTLPSLSVSPEKQTYRCFSCGASGNVFTFLENYEHISFDKAVSVVENTRN